MKIEHIAIWCQDIESMKNFYQKYFNVSCNTLYTNPKKGFSSYFLTFPEGSRIELMNKENLQPLVADSLGYAHIAVSVGSKAEVDRLTNQLAQDGFNVVGEPRTTGDGYYESVIQDIEGNLLELTI